MKSQYKQDSRENRVIICCCSYIKNILQWFFPSEQSPASQRHPFPPKTGTQERNQFLGDAQMLQMYWKLWQQCLDIDVKLPIVSKYSVSERTVRMIKFLETGLKPLLILLLSSQTPSPSLLANTSSCITMLQYNLGKLTQLSNNYFGGYFSARSASWKSSQCVDGTACFKAVSQGSNEQSWGSHHAAHLLPLPLWKEMCQLFPKDF